MNCDVCKQNQATVFLTQIVDGKMQKVNLCESCSKEKGVTDPTGFALADLLLGLGAAQEIERGGGITKCPVLRLQPGRLQEDGTPWLRVVL
jgi:protein arginine kinase activator